MAADEKPSMAADEKPSMAADADADAPPPAKKPPRPIKKKKKKEEARADHPCSLPWTQSIPSDDHFSLLLGSSEGGFLSLEEIDELEYGLVPGTSRDDGGEVLRNSMKRKRRRGDDDSGDGFSVQEEVAAHVEESESRGKSGDEKKNKKKKKKKMKLKRRKSEKSKVVDEADVEKSEGCVSYCLLAPVDVPWIVSSCPFAMICCIESINLFFTDVKVEK